jgi:hypothetical protein
LADEKIKHKVLACTLKLLNNFEILPLTRFRDRILQATHFKDPKAAILTLKMLTGSRL